MYNNKTVQEYVKKKKQLLKEEIDKLEIKPHLSIIQVGSNPSSNSYIKGKLKDCQEVGINAYCTHFNEDVTEKELLEYIEILNKGDSINGIIVQLPLPKHIDIKKVQLAIDPKKDVDGFHPMSNFKPCTPLGVINFLKSQNYKFEGKRAVVIGRSECVGKPLAQMLTDLDAIVTLCHSKSEEYIGNYIQFSDIVFTCINQIEYFDCIDFHLISGRYVKDIIDIGLGLGEDNKLHGNIEKESIKEIEYSGKSNIVSGIGGVGLLTRLSLLENTFKAYNLKKGNIINEGN